MYRGNRKFTREQVLYVVEMMIQATLDMFNGLLPRKEQLEEQEVYRSTCAEYAEMLGENLSIFAANLVDDGIGTCDALNLCGDIDQALQKLYHFAWSDPEKNSQWGGQPIHRFYGPYWPDSRQYAEIFVRQAFEGYEFAPDFPQAFEGYEFTPNEEPDPENVEGEPEPGESISEKPDPRSGTVLFFEHLLCPMKPQVNYACDADDFGKLSVKAREWKDGWLCDVEIACSGEYGVRRPCDLVVLAVQLLLYERD